MSYTINIGLNNPFTKGVNSIDQTIKAALGAVADVTNIRVSYDSDEPTVIIDFLRVTGSLLVLATALDQDCIAVYNHSTDTGELIGDKADAWGPFNIEYFQFV